MDENFQIRAEQLSEKDKEFEKVEHEVTTDGDELKVRYYFEFENGRNGIRVVTYPIQDKKIDTATITFKWKKDPRIFIDTIPYDKKNPPKVETIKVKKES